MQPVLFEYYLAGLRSIWLSIDVATSTLNESKRTAIQNILEECENASNDWNTRWQKAHEFERRLVEFLSREQLHIQCSRRLLEAERLGLPSHAVHKRNIEAALAEGDSAPSLAQLRAAYDGLLDDLHWGYGKRRLDQQTRHKAVEPIIWFAVLLVVIVGGILFASGQFLSNQPHLHALAIVVSFGLLGSFFSRLIAFHSKYASVDYDEINMLFRPRNLAIRLVIGAIGSIILFYAIFGNLIGGELFPNIACLAAGPADAQECTVASWFSSSKIHMSLPAVDFSKLVVWSFIGGFSEMLIPDFLKRTESDHATAAK